MVCAWEENLLKELKKMYEEGKLIEDYTARINAEEPFADNGYGKVRYFCFMTNYGDLLMTKDKTLNENEFIITPKKVV